MAKMGKSPPRQPTARQKGEPELPTEALEVRRAAREPVKTQLLHILFMCCRSRLENDLVAVLVPSL